MNKLLPALMFASVLSVPSVPSFAAEQPPVAKPVSSQMLVYINLGGFVVNRHVCS